MFEFEACDVFNPDSYRDKEFTYVNDCFKDKHNEEPSEANTWIQLKSNNNEQIGHYGQALIKTPLLIIQQGSFFMVGIS